MALELFFLVVIYVRKFSDVKKKKIKKNLGNHIYLFLVRYFDIELLQRVLATGDYCVSLVLDV